MRASALQGQLFLSHPTTSGSHPVVSVPSCILGVVHLQVWAPAVLGILQLPRHLPRPPDTALG